MTVELIVSGGSGLTDIVASARRAEEAGLAGVWGTEFYDRSAPVSLAAMAHATQRVTVGSAIAYAFGRTPVALAKGAQHAGRDESVPIAGYLTCSVNADRAVARDAARAVVAFNSTVKTYRVVHRLHGFEDHAERIRERWMAGDFAAAVREVPDEMLDTIALAGTPDEVRERFSERWEGVYEHTLLWPPAFGGVDAVDDG